VDHCPRIFDRSRAAHGDAGVIHLLCKPPARRNIAEDHIARVREQQVPKLKPVSKRTRKVELHEDLIKRLGW
jgi:hypothetical protein